MRLLGRRPLRFACSCSRERVEDTLRSLGLDETLAAARDGETEVHCDFCGQAYQLQRTAGPGPVRGRRAPTPPDLNGIQ